MTSPWLYYYLGTSQLLFDLQAARSWYKRSYEGFTAQPDATGAHLT